MNQLIAFLTASLLVASYSYAQNWAKVSAVTKGISTFYTDTIADVLYIGGDYKLFNGDTMYGITKYDGINFFAMDCGMEWDCVFPIGNPNSSTNGARDIVRYNNEIYVTGVFRGPNNEFNGLAKWDGSKWVPQGTGLKNGAGIAMGISLKVINNELYVCGNGFDSCASVAANGIAKFDGSQWSDVHNFPKYNIGTITDVAMYQGDLYVGGNFYDSINGDIWRIARWNGSKWVGVAGGIQGGIADVSTMLVYKGLLYVAGAFDSAGNNPFARGLATWDGTKWENVGGGIGYGYSHIWDMKVHNNKLYVVGGFTDAGGTGIHHIASWDGTNWCGYGVTDTTFDTGVSAIGFYHDTMYIGGGFKTIDGDTISYIAKYIGAGPLNCGNRTGIKVAAKQSYNVRIYPNPSQNQLTISANDVSGPYQLQILNMLGDAVLTKNGTFNGSVHIQHALLAGVYLVQLKVGEEMYSRKLIVERD